MTTENKTRYQSITTSEKGNPIEHTLLKTRGSLLLRVMESNRGQFYNDWINRLPVSDMARKYDIGVSDIEFLVDYWELPERQKPRGGRTIEVDKLAERLWEILQPKIRSEVEAVLEERLGS